MTNAEREAWALFRYRLISPLLDPALTPGDRRAYTQFLATQPPTPPTGMPYLPSARSLRRYQATFRRGAWMPCGRSAGPTGGPGALFPTRSGTRRRS